MALFRPTYTRNGEKRPSRHWWLEYREDGRRYRVNLKKTDKRAAQIAAAKILSAVEQGTGNYETTRSLAVDDLLAEYVSELDRRARSVIHVKSTRTRLMWFFGEVSTLADLTPERIRTLLTRLSQTRLKSPNHAGAGRIPCAKTVNDYRAALHGIFAWLVREDRWPRNPVDAVPRVRSTGPTRQRRALELDQLEPFFASVPPDRGLVYRVAATTGLRRAELGSLVWADVDFTLATVTIRARSAKNRRDAHLPLAKTTLAALHAARGEARDEDKVFRTIPDIQVFYNDLKRAGIKVDTAEGRVDFHPLRATFATSLARTGAPLVLAQRLMRHSTPTLTANVSTKLGAVPVRATPAGVFNVNSTETGAPGFSEAPTSILSTQVLTIARSASRPSWLSIVAIRLADSTAFATALSTSSWRVSETRAPSISRPSRRCSSSIRDRPSCMNSLAPSPKRISSLRRSRARRRASRAATSTRGAFPRSLRTSAATL